MKRLIPISILLVTWLVSAELVAQEARKVYWPFGPALPSETEEATTTGPAEKPPATSAEFTSIRLKHVNSAWARLFLLDYFDDDEEKPKLVDAGPQQLIVRASPETTAQVLQLLKVVDIAEGQTETAIDMERVKRLISESKPDPAHAAAFFQMVAKQFKNEQLSGRKRNSIQDVLGIVEALSRNHSKVNSDKGRATVRNELEVLITELMANRQELIQSRLEQLRKRLEAAEAKLQEHEENRERQIQQMVSQFTSSASDREIGLEKLSRSLGIKRKDLGNKGSMLDTRGGAAYGLTRRAIKDADDIFERQQDKLKELVPLVEEGVIDPALLDAQYRRLRREKSWLDEMRQQIQASDNTVDPAEDVPAEP